MFGSVQYETAIQPLFGTHQLPAGGHQSSTMGDLMLAAERELGAFLLAVTRRSGREAAGRAANFWIEALDAADLHCQPTEGSLRAITISATVRLAV